MKCVTLRKTRILAGNRQQGVGPSVLSFRRRPRGNSFLTKRPGSDIFIARSVGLKTLKNKLSEYVRLNASGTDRDRVVAEIGPPAVLGADASDELLVLTLAAARFLGTAESSELR
jgi:hypothetical protein